MSKEAASSQRPLIDWPLQSWLQKDGSCCFWIFGCKLDSTPLGKGDVCAVAPVGVAPLMNAEQIHHREGGVDRAEAVAPGSECRATPTSLVEVWLSFPPAYLWLSAMTRGLSHCDRGRVNKEADRRCPRWFIPHFCPQSAPDEKVNYNAASSRRSVPDSMCKSSARIYEPAEPLQAALQPKLPFST